MADKRISESFTKKKEYERELARIKKGFTPVPVDSVIHYTTRCNHKCNFCYHLSAIERFGIKHFDLDMNTFTRILDGLKRLKTERIIISGGGEPLLNPLNEVFLDILLNNGWNPELYTNLDTEKEMSSLIDYSKISINLNTINPKSYEITRNSKNIDRVLNNIEELSKIHNNVGVNIIVKEDTYKELDKTLASLLLYPISFINVSPAWNIKYFDGISQKNLSDLFSQDSRIRFLQDLPKPFQINGKSKCLSHSLNITLGADGKIYPCCATAYFPEYDLFQIGGSSNFVDLWEEKEKKHQILDVNCEECWLSSLNMEVYNARK